jgi:glycosyltransferase involved in cell wall biosynthesis
VHLVAFTDYVYREANGVVYAERAFALFLAALGDRVGSLTIVGRLDPGPGAARYPLPADVSFVGLPHYASLAHPLEVIGSLARAVRRFWRVLDDADCVWLLGPQPHAVAFAATAKLRRKKVILGVRQDFPAYARRRRPERRWMHLAADVLELVWRALAYSCPVIVVGAALEHEYRHAPSVLQIAVSLISAQDIEAGARAASRSYDEDLQLLSVGRIDREKNPLLLADAFARVHAEDPRWRLLVCGEGPLTSMLEGRLAELGLSHRSELRGYVPLSDGLLELYRSSHAFLHVSLTEGMPQVLLEAFASGVAVVATAVGGVADAAVDAALLIPPEDADAAAVAVLRIGREPALRNAIVMAGLRRARDFTLDAESAKVSRFITEFSNGTAAQRS